MQPVCEKLCKSRSRKKNCSVQPNDWHLTCMPSAHPIPDMNTISHLGWFASRHLSILCLGVLTAVSARATTILYPDFSDISGLQRNGSTAAIANPVTTADGKVLRLTNNTSQSGSAFSKTAITLQNNNSFSTAFSFRITNPLGISDVDGQGADGIVFVVQTVSNTAGGAGGGIGYSGIPRSVGIEFDTWDNGGWDDFDGNHLGIDIGGEINSVVQTHITPRMNDGSRWYSWVDYNGTTKLLEARLSQSNLRPLLATLSYNVDLVNVLQSPNAFVGFTSGTGAAGGNHDIINWEFRDTYNPVNAPDGGSTLALLGLALVGIGLRQRRASRGA
jgi:hypothetical protein